MHNLIFVNNNAGKQIPFNRSTEIYLTSQTNYDGENKCGV